MIDPQKLLGGFLNTALSSGLKTGKKAKDGMGLGGLLDTNKAAVGMGLLGLAIGAFEHFTQQGGQTTGPVGSQPTPPVPPPVAGGTIPPPLPVAGGTVPPSLPGSMHENVTPPGLPPLPTASLETANQQNNEALLLIRAMIAAANADYSIDENERNTILARVQAAGLDEQEREFILQELDHPLGIVELTSQVQTPMLAEQVYAVSLIATQADTEIEQNYLRSLARRLKLDESTLAKWHQQLGIENF